MYEEKISSASALIAEHNETVGKDENGNPNPGWIDIKEFITCLKASGGTSDERLKGCSYEDILSCLPKVKTPSGVDVFPRVVAKEIAKIFRGNESVENRPISRRRIECMTLKELVEHFDPEEDTSFIARRLHEISKEQAFIVFERGHTVDVETTIKLLLEIKQGHKGRSDIKVNDKIKRVYKIGQLPDNYAVENPLYLHRPLRPDGTCDQTGRSWEGVSLEIMQLVRLAITTNELQVSLETAHNILDMVMGENAEEKLRNRYRKASILFDENPDNRPKLKISLNGSSKGNPLKDGYQVKWKKEGNSYRCLTSEHKVYTKNRGFIKAANLTSSDDVATF